MSKSLDDMKASLGLGKEAEVAEAEPEVEEAKSEDVETEPSEEEEETADVELEEGAEEEGLEEPEEETPSTASPLDALTSQVQALTSIVETLVTRGVPGVSSGQVLTPIAPVTPTGPPDFITPDTHESVLTDPEALNGVLQAVYDKAKQDALAEVQGQVPNVVQTELKRLQTEQTQLRTQADGFMSEHKQEMDQIKQGGPKLVALWLREVKDVEDSHPGWMPNKVLNVALARIMSYRKGFVAAEGQASGGNDARKPGFAPTPGARRTLRTQQQQKAQSALDQMRESLGLPPVKKE